MKQNIHILPLEIVAMIRFVENLLRAISIFSGRHHRSAEMM